MACSSEYDDWCFFRGSGGMHGENPCRYHRGGVSLCRFNAFDRRGAGSEGGRFLSRGPRDSLGRCARLFMLGCFLAPTEKIALVRRRQGIRLRIFRRGHRIGGDDRCVDGLLPPFVPGLFAGASLALMGMIWLRTCARYAMVDVWRLPLSLLRLTEWCDSRRRPCFPRNGISRRFYCRLRRLRFSFKHRIRIDTSSSEETCGDQPDSSTSLGQRFSFALKILWLPASGAMLSVFIFGLTWGSLSHRAK